MIRNLKTVIRDGVIGTYEKDTESSIIPMDKIKPYWEYATEDDLEGVRMQIGADGKQAISAEDLGNLSGRFNYELVCDINKRVPRVYIRDGI